MNEVIGPLTGHVRPNIHPPFEHTPPGSARESGGVQAVIDYQNGILVPSNASLAAVQEHLRELYYGVSKLKYNGPPLNNGPAESDEDSD